MNRDSKALKPLSQHSTSMQPRTTLDILVGCAATQQMPYS